MSLYHKHRPQTLEEMMGNTAQVKAIQAHFAQPKEKWSHAHAITGPSGCGKTTIARILANTFLGADQTTFREINTADDRGIATVREINDQMKVNPIGGGNLVFLIDEAHGLTKDAKRALLKPLEDCPPHVFFFLCTTNATDLFKGDEGKAIKTRCTKWQVESIGDKGILRLINKVARAEKISLTEEVVEMIVAESYGSPREALVGLEMVAPMTSPEEMIDVLQCGIISDTETLELCQALMGGRWSKVATILQALKKQGTDPENARRGVLGYMTAVLLKKDDMKVHGILDAFTEPTYNSGFPGLVSNAYVACHP